MKKEIITILLGIGCTILVLSGTIFSIYKLESKKTNENTKVENKNEPKPVVKKEEKEESSPKENNTNGSNTSKTEHTLTSEDNKNNKVTLYLFHGSTCPACQNTIANFKENLVGKYDYLEIKAFEIYDKSTDNSKLMRKVAEALNVEARGIPFIVIGDYSRTGGSKDKDFLVDEITYQNKKANYTDIVAKVISENPELNIKSEILK